MMQFDVNNLLASILAGGVSGNASVEAVAEDRGFGQVLEGLRAALMEAVTLGYPSQAAEGVSGSDPAPFAERTLFAAADSSGQAAMVKTEAGVQVPMDVATLVEWMKQMEASLQDREEGLLENLQALGDHLEAALKQIHETDQQGQGAPAEALLTVPSLPAVMGAESGGGDFGPGLASEAVAPPVPGEGREAAFSSPESFVNPEAAGPLEETDIPGPKAASFSLPASIQPRDEAAPPHDHGQAPPRQIPADADTIREATSQGGQESSRDAEAFPPAGRSDPVADASAWRRPGGDELSAVPSLSEVAGEARDARMARPAWTLAQPLDRPQWADELGERLLWMHGRGIQTADLRIHPQHLGPLEVRIQMHEDQTTIQFASQHGVVREAIEAALPRLREMFTAQQLPLTHVEVGQQSLSDQQPSRQGQGWAPHDRRLHGEGEREGGEQEAGRPLPLSGLLNLYA